MREPQVGQTTCSVGGQPSIESSQVWTVTFEGDTPPCPSLCGRLRDNNEPGRIINHPERSAGCRLLLGWRQRRGGAQPGPPPARVGAQTEDQRHTEVYLRHEQQGTSMTKKIDFPGRHPHNHTNTHIQTHTHRQSHTHIHIRAYAQTN